VRRRRSRSRAQTTVKYTFLFGSGVSVPAEAPSMDGITEQVLSGDAVAQRYVASAREAVADGPQRLLSWLAGQVRSRYSEEPDRRVNYEDLYFLATQIDDDLTGNYDNPAIRPFLEEAAKNVLPKGPPTATSTIEELQRLAHAAADRIRDCVRMSLRLPLGDARYLDFIAEATAAAGTAGTDILTLNHDRLVEQYFHRKGIPFADGFDRQPNEHGVRRWNPDVFDDSTHVVRLLKLHGGVDWYRIEPSGAEPWTEEYLGIPTDDRQLCRHDQQGRPHRAIGEPVFLIGTFNKLWRYTDTAYVELYWRACQILDATDVLVVIGYGFGDKGINKRITDWLISGASRRMVVVDIDACNLWKRGRVSIASKWHDWVEAKRLFPVQFDLKQRLPWELLTRLVKGGDAGLP
jgi:hypothetical protein